MGDATIQGAIVDFGEVRLDPGGDGRADFFPGDGERLLADRLKLQELVLNLLSNAVKYTQKGGWVRLTVTQETRERALPEPEKQPAPPDSFCDDSAASAV